MFKLDPFQVTKFSKPIRRLSFFQPIISVENNRILYNFQVESCEFLQQILPDEFGVTKVWGFGGRCIDFATKTIHYGASSPGPIFLIQRNIETKIQWSNHLSGQYMFPIDTTLLWANPKNLNPDYDFIFPYGDFKAQAPVPMVIHIHGAQLPPEYDGHPDAWYTMNMLRGPRYLTDTYRYLNTQEASTLWYHDNTRGVTRLNRYSGLVGAYIIKDFWNEPYADLNEITLVIQDKSFYEDASLYYPETSGDVKEYPFWVSEFYGDIIVVNGVSWPYMEIENSYYRFRILNASNNRKYELCLSDNHEFIQIGTEGGYREYPQNIECFGLSPGERIDIIINFKQYHSGDTIVLKNKAVNAQIGTTDTIMQFKILDRKDNTSLNFHKRLNTITSLEPDYKGELTTIQEMKNKQEKRVFLFDGQESENPPSNNTLVGATFIWDFVNLLDNEESVHLHLIQFQILQRQIIDKEAYKKEWIGINGNLALNKPTVYLDPTSFQVEAPKKPETYEMGWKDTLNLPSAAITRIVVRYAPTDVMEVTIGENKFPFDPTIGGEYIFNSTRAEHFDNDAIRPQFILIQK